MFCIQLLSREQCERRKEALKRILLFFPQTVLALRGSDGVALECPWFLCRPGRVELFLPVVLKHCTCAQK